MPNAALKLKPGVDTTQTPLALQAGYVTSSNIRWRGGLAEKIGGWAKLITQQLSGIARDVHAWADLNSTAYLSVATTSKLYVISNGAAQDITPQTLTTNSAPKLSTTSGSATVTIDDAGISNQTLDMSVYFNTPVSIGGLVLWGRYPIASVTGSTTYTITANKNATGIRATATISGATQANPCVITATAHGFSNGDIVYIASVSGMTQLNGKIYTVGGATANTFQLTGVDSTGYTAYTSGGFAYAAKTPSFSVTSGSNTVTVTIEGHGLSVGNTIYFSTATSIGGVTVSGGYTVASVPTSSTFTIRAASGATSSAVAMMNAGSMQLVYDCVLGSGGGYGSGNYGAGVYGVSSVTAVTGAVSLSTTDWVTDNWGSYFVGVPNNGALYVWNPTGGFLTAGAIQTAPSFNSGCFVSNPAQILVCYGSTAVGTIGETQDPLLVRWSDQQNYTIWTASATNYAGSFRIPTGSKIIGGLSTRTVDLLWTDVDCWAMNYVGGQGSQGGVSLVYTFNKIGTQCGLVAKHAATTFGASAFWMGTNNFYRLTGKGVDVVPCSVWDAVFQDLDQNNVAKIWTMTNSPYNEIWWFYPSASGGTGQCDKYIKYNIQENAWDIGVMSRSMGIDYSVVGNPIMVGLDGYVYSHETTKDADGSALSWSFTSGYFTLSEAHEMTFVDQIVPDFKYGFYGDGTNATISVTLTGYNEPGDALTTYGPYTVTASTPRITTRFRHRYMSITMSGSDLNSWMRLGNVRFRFAPAGRR